MKNKIKSYILTIEMIVYTIINLCLISSVSIPNIKHINEIGIYEVYISNMTNIQLFSVEINKLISTDKISFTKSKDSFLYNNFEKHTFYINSQDHKYDLLYNSYYPLYLKPNNKTHELIFSSYFLEESTIMIKEYSANTYYDTFKYKVFQDNKKFSHPIKKDNTNEYKFNSKLSKRYYYALLQNIYSRNFLYYPNKISIQQLVFLSKRIVFFIESLQMSMNDISTKINKISKGKQATSYEFDLLLKRLFSSFESPYGSYSNGTLKEEVISCLKKFSLLSNSQIEDMINNNQIHIIKEIDYILNISNQIGEILYEYSDIDDDDQTYNNYEIFNNITNSNIDYILTKEYIHKFIKRVFINLLSNTIGEEIKSYKVNLTKQIFSSKVSSQLKHKERIRSNSFSDKALSGLFGFGELIDKVFFSKIDEKHRIKSFKWKYCLLLEDKYSSIIEPMTSHMSGSFSTTIFAMNLLMNVNTYKVITNTMSLTDITSNIYYSKEYIISRLSMISSQYIAHGYHSAIEIIENVYNSLSYKTRYNIKTENSLNRKEILIPLTKQDVADSNVYNSGHSTEFICDLINEASFKEMRIYDIDKRIIKNFDFILYEINNLNKIL